MARPSAWSMRLRPLATATFLACLAVIPVSAQATRQRQLLDSDWRFHLNELDGNSSIAAAGIPITQWVWIADDNAPTDAATMAAPGLDTSSWTNVAVGTDVFNGRVGYGWFRSTIAPLTSSLRPLILNFATVDDNATVYLNGTLVGQHAGWSEPFNITLDPAWLNGATNFLGVAVQNTGGPGGISGPVTLGTSLQSQPPGMPVTQWLWIADDNAPNDAAAMAAPNLDTSSWTNIMIGQDVFKGRIGAAWFRATLDPLAFAGRPFTLHFLDADDNATVFLNGALLGTHAGAWQAFEITGFDAAWNGSGPNVLTVAVQNGGGSGGLLGPVVLQSGSQVPAPGQPVTQWVWIPDDYATNDAAAMTATNLDTSSWATASIGQDVFSNRVGWAWFRASLDSVTTSGRPLTLHFLGVDDNARVYLNDTLLGQHSGAAQPFYLSPLDPLWITGGPNVLAVAVQNLGGTGGILKPVLLQAGEDIQDLYPVSSTFNDSAWRVCHLPHDYVIEGTFTNTADVSHGSLPLATAWYRKTFYLPGSAQGQSVWLDFDGIYHNAVVWLNGQYLGYWHSGYAPFRYDIARSAVYGATNYLAIHVDPHDSEGWWYEGGGIYRHVWLNLASPLHIAPWGTFVTSAVSGPGTNGNASALLTISTTLTNAGATPTSCALLSQVNGPDGVLAGTSSTALLVPGGSATNVVQTISLSHAFLWSVESPQLYQLHSLVQTNSQTVDNLDTTFGVRSIRFDVTNGFFLNGKPLKLNGTCDHQDFAGVGIGMPDNLLYWRVQRLKQMGSNAYRCSHNPPTEALLDACDRIGMVVMDETRHLGDAAGQKSTTSTTYSDLSELNAMILRDRNHPSIIIWSMCNEEFSVQDTQQGMDMFSAMKSRAMQFDTSRPISCAMNGGWGAGITLVEDLQGCNYGPNNYDSFHASFPTDPMFSSENDGPFMDRGIYASDSASGHLTAYSISAENGWMPIGLRPFIAGGFIWTGFDYKGEPSPYGWPCINSHFGAIDLCGLPKDGFYYYQAWWGTKPQVYIFPHWNWPTPGQAVSVWCFANTDTAELFLNGVSQGVQAVPRYGHVVWSVPYAAGTLSVNGYVAGSLVASNQVVTAGAPAAISLSAERTTLTADSEDLVVVYASVLDSLGHVVPTANNPVTFNVTGAGYVAGVGNGDPSSHEPDRAAQRQAFNGWCMALVAATNAPGALMLTASSPGLTSASIGFQSLTTTGPPAVPLGLSAAWNGTRVNLRWDLSFTATSFNVKRATVSGGPYTTVANYTAITWTDGAVSNGVTYYYVVSALNTNGESANSSEVSVTGSAPAPPVPAGLMAVRDDGQVNLSWTASIGAASYNVKRATNSGGPFGIVAVPSVPAWLDTGLSNETTYYYFVSSVSSGSESGNSSQVSGTPASMSYLVGTIIGTPGSWNNGGNVRELTMDGNLGTFFDAPTNNNQWVGIDLGTNIARAVSKIRFAPRSGNANRMSGGMFQGGNQPDFSDALTLYTVTNTPLEGFLTSVFLTNAAAFRYLRYLSPDGSYGNIAELEFYSLGPHVSLLTGATLGTSGSWNNAGNTKEKAMDGNITSFFDAPTGNGDWVGLDLGTARVLTSLRYFPRIGYASRMSGGVFQAGNLATFSDAVALLTLTNTPPDSTMTAQSITNAAAYRHVRYLAPTNGFGNVAEVQFYSTTPGPAVIPSAPVGLATIAGHARAQLNWTATPGATSYNIKRGTVSGGPYLLAASSPATIYADSGLAAGTYYYVVSAVNAAGESGNSAQASVTILCAPLPAPASLAATAEPGQLITSWTLVTGATSYSVLRAANSSGPYSLIGSSATNLFSDTRFLHGITNYYMVQGVNDCGPGTNSAFASVVPLPMPQLSLSSSSGQIFLSWPVWAGVYIAYSATNLAPPNLWQSLAQPQNSNGLIFLNVASTNYPQQFFRLSTP